MAEVEGSSPSAPIFDLKLVFHENGGPLTQQPNLKEETAKLVSLQEVDKKIYDLNKEKSAQPKLLEEIQRQFEEKKAKFKSLEEQRSKLLLHQKSI